MNEKIQILDSTLRDGAQGEGISFSVEDKLAVVRLLDRLGIDYIEGGNPGSNPKDAEFFSKAAEIKLKNSRLVAFGSTCRKNCKPENDPQVQALRSAGTGAVCIFGKSWDIHAREILRVDENENMRMITDTCKYFTNLGIDVIFDAEHFFDGYRANAEFAMRSLEAAKDGGAICLVLCDTNGGTFPQDVFSIVQTVKARFSMMKIGFHGHDDCGMAVANSVMAVEAGAEHVQGTFLGYGERSGNANLSAVIPNLQIKRGKNCIPAEKLPLLTATAHELAEISNISLASGLPYVGGSAFAHKAGMHADGVIKLSRSFEHIPPDMVGNERRFPLSEISGRSAVFSKAAGIIPDLTKDSPATAAIINAIKAYENKGYQFDGADASFEMLCRKETGSYVPFFELIDYKIIISALGSAIATVKIKVGDRVQLMAGEGNGPVNALDMALRQALEIFYPVLAEVRLTDYKVRVVDSKDATAAVVRVLITSSDGKGTWTTVGVSGNVVEASWLAPTDSLEYKLLKDW